MNIVPVAARHLPAERARLGSDVAEIADIFYEGIGLHLVVIHDHGDLGEFSVCCGLQRFPELTFLQLTITGEYEYLAFGAVHAVGERHASGLGDSHAKRSGIGDHVRCTDVRMTWQAL